MRPFDGGEELDVTGYACHCPLSDEEWGDRSDQVGEVLDGQADDNTGDGTTRERGHDPA